MATSHYVLAVDGGGSKTEAALHGPDGAVLARARTGPCNLYRDADSGLAAIVAAWDTCCVAAGLDPPMTAGRTCLSAGLAGVSAAAAPARFQAAFPTFAARRLCSDGHIAVVGAFDGGPGALLSIGTGTVGCRIDAAGAFTRLGGWGFPVGDRGGGAWLGAELVTAWLDHRDGVAAQPSAALLWRRLEQRLGPDRASVLAWLRAATPAEFAALAPLLADAHDPVAAALLERAADHLAALARALLADGTQALALGGGLAVLMRPQLARRLPPGALSAAAPAPLHGAWLVGTGRVPPEFREVT